MSFFFFFGVGFLCDGGRLGYIYVTRKVLPKQKNAPHPFGCEDFGFRRCVGAEILPVVFSRHTKTDSRMREGLDPRSQFLFGAYDFHDRGGY